MVSVSHPILPEKSKKRKNGQKPCRHQIEMENNVSGGTASRSAQGEEDLRRHLENPRCPPPRPVDSNPLVDSIASRRSRQDFEPSGWRGRSRSSSNSTLVKKKTKKDQPRKSPHQDESEDNASPRTPSNPAWGSRDMTTHRLESRSSAPQLMDSNTFVDPAVFPSSRQRFPRLAGRRRPSATRQRAEDSSQGSTTASSSQRQQHLQPGELQRPSSSRQPVEASPLVDATAFHYPRHKFLQAGEIERPSSARQATENIPLADATAYRSPRQQFSQPGGLQRPFSARQPLEVMPPVDVTAPRFSQLRFSQSEPRRRSSSAPQTIEDNPLVDPIASRMSRQQFEQAGRRRRSSSNSARLKKKRQQEEPCYHQLGMQNNASTGTATGAAMNPEGEEGDRAHLENRNPAPGHIEDSLLAEPMTPASQQQQQQQQQQFPRPGPCPHCKKEKHDARVYRWKLVGGLLLPYFLSSLDLTIVAASLPWMASYFGKLDELNWIVTAFSLTSAAFIPAFGQLSDVFGRHPVLQFSVFLMLAGSVLCTAAQSWAMLLLGRALQGVSAAGINNLIEIILSDRVSLEDNSKNSTILGMVAGASYCVGPWLGGFLTDINWRYCFLIFIPTSVVAHFAIFIFLRKELVGGTHFKKGSRRSLFLPGLATVDVVGTSLFVSGVTLIIVATSWGGSAYPWTAPQVLAPLISGSILFSLFFVYEYLLSPGRVFSRVFPQQTPMIPSALFKKSDTSVVTVVEFATGAAMFAVFYFIGIYFTIVEGYSASKSGVQLLFYLPGVGAGVYFAMVMCNVWPAQTWYPLCVGTIIEAAGIGLITWAVTTRNLPLVNAMLAVTGAGTGLRFMSPTLHMAGVFPGKIASAMSIMAFTRPFGGTLALAIMSSVFNNKIAEYNPSNSGGVDSNSYTSQSLDSLNALPSAIRDYVRKAAKKSIMWAFVSITPIMAINIVAIFFLGNVWIKSKKAKESLESLQRAGGDAENIRSSEVLDDSFLWALVTGTVESKKYISTPLSKTEKEQQVRAVFEEKSRIRAARKNGREMLSSYPENDSFHV